jgi:hypothetical protein
MASRIAASSLKLWPSGIIMTVGDRYPFLNSALDDIRLASQLTSRDLGTPRQVVTLMHDALEFILYEVLQMLSVDIYKNGQNTIGLDAAIGVCKANDIDLPLLGTIRAIQKHRGDAKHHAQTPHDAAFAKMEGEFRVIVTRLIYERFGQALGADLKTLGLLPYHVALYESYRKYRTHNWPLALRFALGAALHKHRAVLAAEDDYQGGTCDVPTLMALLTSEVSTAVYPPAPSEAVDELRGMPSQLERLIAEGNIPLAAETAGRGFEKVNAILPGVFDIRTARRFTDHLVQPRGFVINRSMSWSKWQRGDTPRKHEVEEILRKLLVSRPELVKQFGRLRRMEDDDSYWQWWEFAVFDGRRWNTFHLDNSYRLSLESGSLSEEDAKRREQVAEAILREFQSLVGES